MRDTSLSWMSSVFHSVIKTNSIEILYPVEGNCIQGKKQNNKLISASCLPLLWNSPRMWALRLIFRTTLIFLQQFGWMYPTLTVTPEPWLLWLVFLLSVQLLLNLLPRNPPPIRMRAIGADREIPTGKWQTKQICWQDFLSSPFRHRCFILKRFWIFTNVVRPVTWTWDRWAHLILHCASCLRGESSRV